MGDRGLFQDVGCSGRAHPPILTPPVKRGPSYSLWQIGRPFAVPLLAATLVSCAPGGGLTPSGQADNTTLSSPAVTVSSGSAGGAATSISGTSPQNVPALQRYERSQTTQAPSSPHRGGTSWKLTLLGDPAVTTTTQGSGQAGQVAPVPSASSSDESDDCSTATVNPDDAEPEGALTAPVAQTAPEGCSPATKPDGPTATTTPPNEEDKPGTTTPAQPGTAPATATANQTQNQTNGQQTETPNAPDNNATAPGTPGANDTAGQQEGSSTTPDNNATTPGTSNTTETNEQTPGQTTATQGQTPATTDPSDNLFSGALSQTPQQLQATQDNANQTVDSTSASSASPSQVAPDASSSGPSPLMQVLGVVGGAVIMDKTGSADLATGVMEATGVNPEDAQLATGAMGAAEAAGAQSNQSSSGPSTTTTSSSAPFVVAPPPKPCYGGCAQESLAP